MDVKERILQAAEALFFKYGVRSVTMEDVAKSVGMSKKTLYQYYSDKDQLVEASTQSHLDREKAEFDEIYDTAENAIEELFLVSKCLRKNLVDINPLLLLEMKKYYPKAWAKWNDFKDQYVLDSIVKNLDRGIRDGYFREDIDPSILSMLRVWEIQVLFEGEVFPPEKFDFSKVQLQLFNHFVFGISTESGRKLYSEYLESEKSENYA